MGPGSSQSHDTDNIVNFLEYLPGLLIIQILREPKQTQNFLKACIARNLRNRGLPNQNLLTKDHP
jgi:hypothetical protein